MSWIEEQTTTRLQLHDPAKLGHRLSSMDERQWLKAMQWLDLRIKDKKLGNQWNDH